MDLPAGKGDDNGYRWYAADRVEHARLIARLRAVGVPLDAVAACLAAGGDAALVDRALREHLQRLESRLARVRGDLHDVGHLLAGGLSSTGQPRPTAPALPQAPPAPARPTPVADERQLAVDLFNGVWALLSTEDRTPLQDDRMLHMAHASRHHWERTGSPANLARGEWQCSRVYAALGRPEPCLHHAQRVLELCREHRIGDWDLAFAYEALARAHAAAATAPAAVAPRKRARSGSELIRGVLLTRPLLGRSTCARRSTERGWS